MSHPEETCEPVSIPKKALGDDRFTHLPLISTFSRYFQVSKTQMLLHKHVNLKQYASLKSLNPADCFLLTSSSSLPVITVTQELAQVQLLTNVDSPLTSCLVLF